MIRFVANVPFRCECLWFFRLPSLLLTCPVMRNILGKIKADLNVFFRPCLYWLDQRRGTSNCFFRLFLFLPMHCEVQTGYWCTCVWLHCPLLLPSVLMQLFAQCAGSSAIGFHFVGAMSSCLSPRRGRFSLRWSYVVLLITKKGEIFGRISSGISGKIFFGNFGNCRSIATVDAAVILDFSIAGNLHCPPLFRGYFPRS